MAFPLKSGADLYNQQLIRAAIWNHGADPSETVTGLLYFNTSNSSAAKKLRLYTGSAWKTIAFEEDLDVANNADFKALEDKVKLLAGEVDTDAIISNMKEVSNFLAGFAEDAKLMSVLDGKLDKSGGKVIGGGNTPFGIQTTSANAWVGVRFYDSTGAVAGSLGVNNNDPIFVPKELNAIRTLLHSGNVGDYALKINGSNKMAGRLYMNIHAIEWNLNNTVQLLTPYNANNDKLSYYDGSDWKTIAFTDSNVASAQALVHSNGTVGAKVENTGAVTFYKGSTFQCDDKNVAYFGSAQEGMGLSYDGALMYTYGQNRNLYFYTNGLRMLINSSGKVLIGTTDDKGQELQVAGSAAFVSGRVQIPVNGDRITFNADSGNTMGVLAMNLNNTYLEAPLTDAGDKTPILIGWRDGNYAMTISKTGNVGIGITNPSAQLHVAQDIVANGTIACKGIAAEGSEVGMGTVDKKVLYISSSTTQQTFSLTHGLNTREITVCIYEVTSTGTNMILTDVEITGDNTISVSFGNPPTENHMVVVMG